MASLMKMHLLLLLAVVLIVSGLRKCEGRPIVNAPEGYEYGQNAIFYGEPVLLNAGIVEPERTEALINNTMVASGMLYRFLRAIYRAGTIVYSYMPALPNPIAG